MITIPPGLKEAIEADDMVLFIGAGLSWNLKNTKNEPLEGWDKMVKSITSHLKENDYITDNEKQSCDMLTPIDTLQKLETKGINRREVGEFVKHYFTLQKENDFSLHQKLFNLSTKIITTNYDRAFEKAVDDLQEKKAYKTKDYELNRLKKDSVFLFKLHGCIEHIDSMVLFPSDYDNLYKSEGREAEHTLYALRNLIFNKTFLFIGTGLGDPQINGIFKEIKRTQGIYNQEHYIITPDALDDRLKFLTSIQVASHEEIPKVIEQLVEIKQEAEAKKSSEKKTLLDQLKESEKEIDSLSEQLAQVQDEYKRQALLLEREAQNHFNIGLKFHLAGEYLEASKEYEDATVLTPKSSAAYYNWGVALYDLAQSKSGIEAEALYNESFEKYSQAIRIKPDYPKAYYNWGNALSNLAQSKSGIEAEALYNEVFEKYRQAIRIKPDYHDVYYNWGVVLSDLAQSKSGIEAEALYNESFEKYSQAIRIKPDDHEVYYNWGVALYNLVQSKPGIEAEALYNESFEKYRQAIRIKPDYHEAYNNWGVALYNLAQSKSGIEAEALYNEVFEKYRQAIRIKPDNHEVYYNWGVALYNLAQTKSGVAAEKLYDETVEKNLQAIKYGGNAYNLACLYAIRNKKEEALKYLERSLERGEISVDFVEKDTDWDCLRDDSDFKNLLSRYKKDNKNAIL